MTIEERVISLPLARHLKCLGVDKDCLFAYHARGNETYELGLIIENEEDLPAYTSDELGELLPHEVIQYYKQENGRWGSEYFSYDFRGKSFIVTAKTEAESRGLMLVWLIEQGIFKGVN